MSEPTYFDTFIILKANQFDYFDEDPVICGGGHEFEEEWRK